MTKCIVLGEQPTEKKLKPIEFKYVIKSNFEKDTPQKRPHEWENIELIGKNYYGGGYDIMYAYNDELRYGSLYAGHWNDGVVE